MQISGYAYDINFNDLMLYTIHSVTGMSVRKNVISHNIFFISFLSQQMTQLTHSLASPLEKITLPGDDY